MNNLLSYCGLVDARIRVSNKDLPVLEKVQMTFEKIVKPYLIAIFYVYELNYKVN